MFSFATFFHRQEDYSTFIFISIRIRIRDILVLKSNKKANLCKSRIVKAFLIQWIVAICLWLLLLFFFYFRCFYNFRRRRWWRRFFNFISGTIKQMLPPVDRKLVWSIEADLFLLFDLILQFLFYIKSKREINKQNNSHPALIKFEWGLDWLYDALICFANAITFFMFKIFLQDWTLNKLKTASSTR